MIKPHGADALNPLLVTDAELRDRLLTEAAAAYRAGEHNVVDLCCLDDARQDAEIDHYETYFPQATLGAPG